MSDILLGRTDYHRSVAKEARVQTRNRYWERNPILTGEQQTALIARPALRRWLPVGDGPIRGTYSQPGSFDDALFVVSGNEWYRVDKDETITLLTDGINPTNGAVSMAGTGNIGETPEFMYLADGRNLWLYNGDGAGGVTNVATPDDAGVISVGYVASYVVVVPAQGEGINGRFWWIDPGEIVIDPLDFATAERAPDPISGVVVFGDQFWLPGTSTTEVWFFTGDPDAPVRRLQGVAFDRGAWPGTALQVKESMVIVDNDGAVFQIAGGLKRISRPDIEERIRKAIQYQAARGF